MKSAALAILGIVIVVLVAAAAFFLVSKKRAEAPASTSAPVAAQPAANSTAQTPTTPSASNPAQYVPDNLVLGTDGNATLGTYLIGYNGLPVYEYAKDTAGVSTCTGSCAAQWLPYVMTASAMSDMGNIQAGVSGTLGMTARADGSMQITYDGHPLYFYAGDSQQAGGAKGQGIGGVWSVVKP